nr:MAG TPA: protein of unknown function DUF2301 [Caudoviricetes sp.]
MTSHTQSIIPRTFDLHFDVGDKIKKYMIISQ